MSAVTYKTPLGFVNNQAREIDDDIADIPFLLKELLEKSRHQSSTAWDLRKSVIEMARTLFNAGFVEGLTGEVKGLRNYLLLQYAHGRESGFTSMHYRFLIDTIHYLRSGYRRVQPATVMTMITYQSDALEKVPAQKHDRINERDELLKVIESLTPEEDQEFISIWLRKETGFSDLLYTLNVLFGGVKVKDKLFDDIYLGET